MVAPKCLNACELKNKVLRLALGGVARLAVRSGRILILSLVLMAPPALAQQPPDRDVSPGVAAAPVEQAEHAEEEEHHSVWAGLLWPTVNFAILFGAIWYFLKTPLANYLRDRHSAIRKELVEAASVSATAAAQLAEIERKLQALPGEIAALRQRGTEEIASEEARIAALAAAERERLLEQTRREIEMQVRLAKRELVEHAADLSVQLATNRIGQQITPADQERLVDRYLNDVKGRPA
jgi:F-type H+-transporting ATPase subunit b